MSRLQVVLCLIVALTGVAVGQGLKDSLAERFKDSPEAAKPRAWWHWLNGNVTKERITADLESMKRAGIAGMQMFDGSLGTPQFVDKRLVWMTPEWKDAFHHAAVEADRLGDIPPTRSGGTLLRGKFFLTNLLLGFLITE